MSFARKKYRGLYQKNADRLLHYPNSLLGSSSPAQLEANLVDIEKGPLPKELVDAMEDAWATLKDQSFKMEETFK